MMKDRRVQQTLQQLEMPSTQSAQDSSLKKLRLEQSDVEVVRQQFNSDRAWEVRDILYQILTSNTENEFWGPFRERMRKNQRYCTCEGVEATLRNVGYLVWTTTIAVENQMKKEEELKQRRLEAGQSRPGLRRRRGSCSRLGMFLTNTSRDKKGSLPTEGQQGDDDSTILSVATTLRASFASTTRGSFVSRGSNRTPPGSRCGPSWTLFGNNDESSPYHKESSNDDTEEPPSSAAVAGADDDASSCGTAVPVYKRQSLRSLFGRQKGPASSAVEEKNTTPSGRRAFTRAAPTTVH